MTAQTVTLNLEAWQFLSRANFGQTLQNLKKFPATQRGSTSSMELQCELTEKPFELNFASVVGVNPSIGAHQYVDQNLDISMTHRWPQCLHFSIEATLEIPDAEMTPDGPSQQFLMSTMLYIRDIILRAMKTHPMFSSGDQFGQKIGYRRTYYCHNQSFDISNSRRPNSTEHYHQTAIGEFIGPGLISLKQGAAFREFVWSQFIPFANPTNEHDDKLRVKEIAQRMTQHHRVYKEFADARTDLADSGTRGIKNAVRSAAAGVDAILRFYCDVHGTTFPTQRIPFKDKLEVVLAHTGRPSYKQILPAELDAIGNLYTARNSQHVADCTYENGSVKITVDAPMAQSFIEAAERFSVWMDSLA
ncbi:hypothetical protein [Undibacterium sp.]|jgi:hypothetical protein|uniref:hypothetical protein n=1 Tax=Undibacterium sp. TaxID=1914977 RepID=UPI002BE2C890|nr:hypothetical protein [Undibacterium sp.]HTD05069.1 hypothetical protein [Undibacterium sp.]